MKSWRAKQYRLKISRRTVLILTLRRFRTNQANRSQQFSQWVISCKLGSVKEIALRFKTKKRSKRLSLAIKGPHKLRLSVPLTMLMIGFIGSIFFGQQIIYGAPIQPPETFSAPRPEAIKKTDATFVKPLAASIPTNISIPAVNIKAPVKTVGMTSTRAIEMPPVLEWTTGWYKYSPTPGQTGPAIIVGHVDNYKNVSVFWRLRYVQPGDDIFVTRADGGVVAFKVNALKQFSQADFPTQEVYGNISYPGLRLITCGGTFNKATDSYDQNTVVYASMVN